MNRKDFIRNTIMALAASILPKPLLPAEPEIEEMKPPCVRFLNKYEDGAMYKVTYGGEYGGYTFWASGRMLNEMDHCIEQFRYKRLL